MHQQHCINIKGCSARNAIDGLDQGDCRLGMLSCHHSPHLVAVCVAVCLTSFLLQLLKTIVSSGAKRSC